MENLIKSVRDKKVTIIGAGISGKAASELACYLGAKVILTDDNNKKEILNDNNKIKYCFGYYPDESLNSELVIVSPGIDCNKNIFIKKVKQKKRPIVSEREFASWFTNSKTIAITGSNGKSTVVEILGKVFKLKFPNTMIGGNIGIPYSSNVLNELKNKLKHVIHILEISSYQLEKVYFFKPEISCILNIAKDHLERYGSYKNYYQTKFKIYNENKLFYNGEDEILKERFSKTKHTTPFSTKNDKEYSINEKKIFNKLNNDHIDLSKINLLGNHNIENIFAVLYISNEMNIEFEFVKKIIYNFKSLEHRMEKINSNPLIINDSKSTNLHSCKAAVNSFDENMILILGGYSNEKIEKDEIISIVNKKTIKRIICYGEIGETIYGIIKNYKKSKYINNFKEAIFESLDKLSKNEILLFSPGFKSFDQFINFEERGIAFRKNIEEYFKK